MSHLDPDLLTAFTEGTLGEHLAVHVAEHLDACPQCAARADALDPLHDMFVEAAEPAMPEDLIASILAADSGPSRLPVAELATGTGMLALSSALALAPGDLLELTRPLHAFISGLTVGAHHLVSDGLVLSVMTLLVVGLGTAMLGQRRRVVGGAW